MPLRTPAQYRESLRDGRKNYFDGELVEDVTTHPRFRLALETGMTDYQYDVPGRRAATTYVTEEGGEAHRVFQIPRTEDDLQKRVVMIRASGPVIGTTGVFMALQVAKEEVAKVSPERAENIDRMYRWARDNDIRAAEAITDAKGDRSRKPHDQDDPDLYLRIVGQNADGIIVRGAKLHIASAAIVNELVVMPTKSMTPDEGEYSVAFSISPNAPGVTIMNRTYVRPDATAFDFPVTTAEAMAHGFVIFDDVFVPWERVFLAGEWQLAGVFANALGLWERAAGLINSVDEARMLVGMAQLAAEDAGIARASHIQEKISELILWAETVRHAAECSFRNFTRTAGGMIHPGQVDANIGKYLFASRYHEMLRHVHDVAGGLIATMPRETDLRNEETGKYLRKYLHTRADVDIEDRMRLYALIRDKTADALGGHLMVSKIHGGGGLATQKIVLNRGYDIEGAKAMAKAAARIQS